MTAVSRTRTIDRSPKEVWAILADFGAISAWADNADHSCPLGPADAPTEGVGVVRRIQAGRLTLVERVTTWDEPEGLAYTIEGLPKVVRAASNEWSLVPAGTATEATLTTRVDCGPRPPQKLLARIVARRLAKASDTMLAGLARTLETESSPSGTAPRTTPQEPTHRLSPEGDTHV